MSGSIPKVWYFYYYVFFIIIITQFFISRSTLTNEMKLNKYINLSIWRGVLGTSSDMPTRNLSKDKEINHDFIPKNWNRSSRIPANGGLILMD